MNKTTRGERWVVHSFLLHPANAESCCFAASLGETPVALLIKTLKRNAD